MCVLPSINERRQANDSLDSPVRGGDIERVAATERVTPETDAVFIDGFEGLGESDGVAEVGTLEGWKDFLARLAWECVRGAESAVVVCEARYCKTRGQIVGELGEGHLFDAGAAVAEDEAGEFGVCGMV